MMVADRKALFDRWASEYDRAVTASTGQYPFDGYEAVLSALVAKADPQPGMLVLDLGIGTGNLAEHFAKQGCSMWGVDFSEAMLEVAKGRFPQCNLVHGDLLGAWPESLPTIFDRVVSAYVFHEFDLACKVRLISRTVKRYLAPGGYLLVADISFPNVTARAAAAERWADLWDEKEHYWAADETLEAIAHTGIAMQYRQISSCAGVFSFSRKDLNHKV